MGAAHLRQGGAAQSVREGARCPFQDSPPSRPHSRAPVSYSAPRPPPPPAPPSYKGAPLPAGASGPRPPSYKGAPLPAGASGPPPPRPHRGRAAHLCQQARQGRDAPGRSQATTSKRTSRPSAARPRSMTRPSTGVSTLPPQRGTTTRLPCAGEWLCVGCAAAAAARLASRAIACDSSAPVVHCAFPTLPPPPHRPTAARTRSPGSSPCMMAASPQAPALDDGLLHLRRGGVCVGGCSLAWCVWGAGVPSSAPPRSAAAWRARCTSRAPRPPDCSTMGGRVSTMHLRRE